MTIFRMTGVATLLVCVAGCAGAPVAGGGRFPTRAELSKLSSTPPPKLSTEGRLDVPRFTLIGPLPDKVELTAQTPSTPWEQLLASAAQERHGLVYLPQSMSCVAREAGRYVLETGKLPARTPERFIRARCGVASPELSLWTSTATIPAAQPEQQVFDQWKNEMGGRIGKALAGRGSQLAGIWFGRKGDKAVLLLAVASRQVELEPLPVAAGAEGKVVLRGEMLTPAGSIEALVNVGAHGYRACINSTAVALPQFEITCEVDPQDRATWIEVASFPAGRLVGHSVIDVMIGPSGTPGDTYERPSYGEMTDDGGGEVAARLLAMVNGVRQRASLSPLTYAPEQSATATRLAPFYFAALVGLKPETVADQVVLGLRAGWDVPGVVRYGQLTASLAQQTNDLQDLLVSALERPSGRQTLLDPDVKVLAVGPIVEADAVAAMLATYALMDDAAPAVNVKMVVGRILTDRGNRQQPMTDARLRIAAERALNDVAAGRLSSKQALQAALDLGVETTHRSLQGWVVEVTNVDQLQLPAEIVKTTGLTFGAAVKAYKPAGEPWGRYLVIILYYAGDSA
jgi:hypothetical protein